MDRTQEEYNYDHAYLAVLNSLEYLVINDESEKVGIKHDWSDYPHYYVIIIDRGINDIEKYWKSRKPQRNSQLANNAMIYIENLRFEEALNELKLILSPCRESE